MMNLNIGQVAEQVGVTRQTLARWEADGLIPPAKRKFINKWRTWTALEVEMIKRVVKERSKPGG